MDFDIGGIVEKFQKGQVMLVTAPSERMQELNKEILKYFTREEQALTIYVTVSKPYSTLNNMFEEAGIETDNVFYVDCVSKMASGSSVDRLDNVVFLDSPQSLTNISISLSEAVDSLPEDRERLLIFDTLSTLMIYNDKETVSKFAHTLTSKIRDWNIKSLILTLDEETEESIKSQLVQFADEVIELE